MSKIMSDELWNNFSLVVRDNRTDKIGYVKIKDFFESIDVEGGGEERRINENK